MNRKERKELYQEAISKWGEEAQIFLLFEEIGELMKAINKYQRSRHEEIRQMRRGFLLEEVADVEIMLEQLLTLTGIKPEEIEDEKRYKLERLRETLERTQD